MSKYGEPWSLSHNGALETFDEPWLGRCAVDNARAVACVNACEGIDDPSDLRKQRDALLFSCRELLECMCDEDIGADAICEDECERARAAIALCEKEGSGE